MQDRTIPTKVLLTETLRMLPQSALFVVFVALICVVAYSAAVSLAIAAATFSSLTFIAAPLACSATRSKRGLPLITRAGGKTILFCFIWGGIVVAAFIAFLQASQGMGATMLNYVVAIISAGTICAALALFPSAR